MIRRSTSILLVVFVVILAGVLFWQRTKISEEAKITPTTVQEYLFDFDAEITNLKIDGPNNKVLELERDNDGQWVLVQPEDEETDTATVETATSRLFVLLVLAHLEQDAVNISDIGLDEPSFEISMTLDNGSVMLTKVGDLTPTDSGYYVSVNGHGIVVVDKFGLQTILDLLENHPIQPTSVPIESTPNP